jgi:hypothetical protein
MTSVCSSRAPTATARSGPSWVLTRSVSFADDFAGVCVYAGVSATTVAFATAAIGMSARGLSSAVRAWLQHDRNTAQTGHSDEFRPL